MNKSAKGADNFTQCDSMLIGEHCSANTFPYIDVRNASSTVGHEATTVKVTDEDALGTIINGFCNDVFKVLPGEFAVEATQLLSLKLENVVG